MIMIIIIIKIIVIIIITIIKKIIIVIIKLNGLYTCVQMYVQILKQHYVVME